MVNAPMAESPGVSELPAGMVTGSRIVPLPPTAVAAVSRRGCAPVPKLPSTWRKPPPMVVPPV